MATIFLDMDGVVADFDAMTEQVIGYRAPGSISYPPHDWIKIKKNPRFFLSLPKCPGADELVQGVLLHELNVKFLSALPANNDVPWALYDKIKWVENHFGNIPVWFGPFSHEKCLHCQPGDILIDDRISNINEWKNVGGVGIHHVYGDTKTSLKLLNDIVRNM